jgi:hypothetical protein
MKMIFTLLLTTSLNTALQASGECDHWLDKAERTNYHQYLDKYYECLGQPRPANSGATRQDSEYTKKIREQIASSLSTKKRVAPTIYKNNLEPTPTLPVIKEQTSEEKRREELQAITYQCLKVNFPNNAFVIEMVQGKSCLSSDNKEWVSRSAIEWIDRSQTVCIHGVHIKYTDTRVYGYNLNELGFALQECDSELLSYLRK